MGPKSGWGGVVRIGYVRPVQFLDHLTVIKMDFFLKCYYLLYGIRPPLLAAIETSANIAKVPRAVAKLIRIVLPVRHLHLQKIEIVFPVYITLYNCLSISDGEDP